LVVSGIARLPVWRVRARKNVPANADKHSTAQHSLIAMIGRNAVALDKPLIENELGVSLTHAASLA
jgi:hypothetical protein